MKNKVIINFYGNEFVLPEFISNFIVWAVSITGLPISALVPWTGAAGIFLRDIFSVILRIFRNKNMESRFEEYTQIQNNINKLSSFTIMDKDDFRQFNIVLTDTIDMIADFSKTVMNSEEITLKEKNKMMKDLSYLFNKLQRKTSRVRFISESSLPK